MATAESATTSSTLPGTSLNLCAGSVARYLKCLDAILSDGDLPLPRELHRIRQLEKRLVEGRFHLAVLGQFKRGKSSLLNALIGEPLLPVSVVPLTAVPTFVRWGESPFIRIDREEGKTEEFGGGTIEDRRDFLARYVTEENNPKNRLGVCGVEVFLPSPLLGKSVVLIDTPGIGSVYRHNTEATLNFLPQCDAALFLVSADPPITEVEVAFLQEVRKRIPRLFFVLNKIDYLTPEECEAAIRFLKKTLHDQVGCEPNARGFPLSARQGLQARKTGDETLWRESGLDSLEAHLVDFLISEKAGALAEAVASKAHEIVEGVLMHLRLRLRSLKLPQNTFDEKLAAFDKVLNQILRDRVITQDLLAGDKRRAIEYLEEQACHLRRQARKALENALRNSPAVEDNGRVHEAMAQEVLAEAIPAFFEKQLGGMAGQMNEYLAQILEPYHTRLNELVDKIRKTAADLFEIPHTPMDVSHVFEFRNEPYWVTHKWDSTFSPIPENWFDYLLPRSIRKKRAFSRLSEKLDRLVMHNVENLRWATLQNLNRAFMRFSSLIDECMEETLASTRGAIEAAARKRAEHTTVIADEVAFLERKIEELERQHLMKN